MIDASNFIVRSSGRRDGRYYIDYVGLYKAAEIAKQANIDLDKLIEMYESNGGVLDPEFDIHYFSSMISAQKTISDIFSAMPKKYRGRTISLTEMEIDYIRKALINETGFAAINNKIKDEIFRKLNG